MKRIFAVLSAAAMISMLLCACAAGDREPQDSFTPRVTANVTTSPSPEMPEETGGLGGIFDADNNRTDSGTNTGNGNGAGGGMTAGGQGSSSPSAGQSAAPDTQR